MLATAVEKPVLARGNARGPVLINGEVVGETGRESPLSLPDGSPLPDGSCACTLPDQSPLCDTVDSGIQSLAKADGSSRKTVYFKKFGHCIQL